VFELNTTLWRRRGEWNCGSTHFELPPDLCPRPHWDPGQSVRYLMNKFVSGSSQLIQMFLQKRKVPLSFLIPRIETRFLDRPDGNLEQFYNFSKTIYSSIYRSFGTTVSQLKICDFFRRNFKGFWSAVKCNECKDDKTALQRRVLQTALWRYTC